MVLKKAIPSVLIFCCCIFVKTPVFATANKLSGHTRYDSAKVISEYYGSEKVQNLIPSTGNQYVKTTNLNLTAKEQSTTDLEKKIQEILSKIITPDMSDLRKELAIHEYLIKNAQYDNDNFLKGTIPWSSYTAYGVLINGIGVCQGYAEAANLLLNKAGIKSTMVAGTADGVGGWGGHAWNIVEINGEHYHLDVTWDESNSKYIDYSYFNLTDDEISKNHKWNRKTAPVCSKKFTTHDILLTNIGIQGEYVYFNDNNTLCKIRLDGTGEQMVLKLDGWGPEIRRDGDWLYIGQRSNNFPSCFSISKLKHDGSEFTIVKEFDANEKIEDFNVKDGYIYIVLSDRIEKMSDDGSVLQTIVVAPQGETIYDDSTIGFDGYWIYYAVSDSNNKKLIYYKVNTDGTNIIKTSEFTF